LLKRSIRAFRASATLPSEGAALPEWIREIGWSDQWAFWRAGYEGIMVTDTAPFRNPHYHTEHDTPETIDYDRLARVADGLQNVVRTLASAQ
jgi:peptidase M28-like protein